MHHGAEGAVASETKKATVRGRMIFVTQGTVTEIALRFVLTLKILQKGERNISWFFSSLRFRTVLTGHMFERVTLIHITHILQKNQNFISCLYCDQCDLHVLWAALVQNARWWGCTTVPISRRTPGAA